MRKSKANENREIKAAVMELGQAMKKSRANGNREADDAVNELCQAIEATLNPIRLLITSDGSSTPDCVSLKRCIERFTYAIDPDYPGLRNEWLMEWEPTDAGLGVRAIEHEAWFAAGHLMGMAQSGRPAEEIRKMASSMVNRQKAF